MWPDEAGGEVDDVGVRESLSSVGVGRKGYRLRFPDAVKIEFWVGLASRSSDFAGYRVAGDNGAGCEADNTRLKFGRGEEQSVTFDGVDHFSR